MNTLLYWVVDHPRTVIAAWLLCVCGGAWLSTNLDGVIRGTTDGIPGSPSEQVMQAIRGAFGPDSAFVFPVVVEHRRLPVRQDEFREAVGKIEQATIGSGNAREVRHFWNSGASELLGADGRSALLLVMPRASSFHDAEIRVEGIRDDIRSADVGAAFTVMLTGPVAVFHDMNRHSADDLLAAERIGVPVTLAILLLVFGAPLAAGLPLALAAIAVVLSLAALFVLGSWMPVSMFARNAVTMIGLGVGVDYALFVLRRFRDELGEGRSSREAAVRAAMLSGGAVLFSGMTVAAGFLVLLLVRVPMMQSLAVGGSLVVLMALAATFTLLPVLLALIGAKIYWPWRLPSGGARRGRFGGWWQAWAHRVMRHPWLALVPALGVVAFFVAPAFRMAAWNPGAKDLPLTVEARQGADALRSNFAAGWLGPVVLAIEARGGSTLWDPASQDAALTIGQRLSRDPRVAHVGSVAADAIAPSGGMAMIVLIPREAPESREAMALVDELRRDAWPEARAAGLTVGVAGASAGIADFDQELFDSLWRIIPAMLVVTFIMLLAMFRSILIPLKATLLNLLSVLASWGFLVLVFQHGIGAGWIGLQPPGGLNAFIVLMLFTILFGLSMDYELFLLSRIKEERERGADNATAVARGLQHTGATISSAALVMICIFGSFAFTELTATREFGVGLAFAVALDATLIRLIMVPALMRLMGEWNWWMPGTRSSALPAQTGSGHGQR